MKKTAKMLAMALVLGICLSTMSLAIAEDETVTVTEVQQEVIFEEVAEEPAIVVEDVPEIVEETEVCIEPDAVEETEVGEEELVEIEDFETPLGLFEPETEFTGSVKLERKGEGALAYGDEVTLTANVSGANMLYNIRWEVNRQDEAGWTTIEDESGADYDFVLTEDNADYEYRVVLVTEA